jgi:two-component sensor histidine kinase
LAALAAAHSILTRTKWESMPIQDIAAEAIRSCEVARRRVRVSGPDLRLGSRAAIAVALALHELCTNAMKYGALSAETGQVDLEWRSFAAPPSFEISWRESGGPPVVPPKRRGFGSKLIERVLAQDIDGEATLVFQPTGLVCTIKAPLPADAGSSAPA